MLPKEKELTKEETEEVKDFTEGLVSLPPDFRMYLAGIIHGADIVNAYQPKNPTDVA